MLAASGGGDSTSAGLCVLRSLCVNNSVTINHSLRYESARESLTQRALACTCDLIGVSAKLRRYRLMLLIGLTRKLGLWRLQTAHTISDNTEHLLGRRVSYSAYSLSIPSLRHDNKVSLCKPWVCVEMYAHARYINDITNLDASALRTLWRQLHEKLSARSRWGVFASTRLALGLY